MLSAVIPSAHSYPAVPLARQPVHERCVHPGPLVLGPDPLNSRTPTADRDRTDSRLAKPNSSTPLHWEHQNSWNLHTTQVVFIQHQTPNPHPQFELCGDTHGY